MDYNFIPIEKMIKKMKKITDEIEDENQLKFIEYLMADYIEMYKQRKVKIDKLKAIRENLKNDEEARKAYNKYQNQYYHKKVSEKRKLARKSIQIEKKQMELEKLEKQKEELENKADNLIKKKEDLEKYVNIKKIN